MFYETLHIAVSVLSDQQLRADIGYRLEDLSEAKDDRDEWRERKRETERERERKAGKKICASIAT